MKNRTWNRAYAHALGYFWLPCPLCQQPFGGHEWETDETKTGGKVASIPCPDGPQGMSWGICPDCTAAGLGWRDPNLGIWEVDA